MVYLFCLFPLTEQEWIAIGSVGTFLLAIAAFYSIFLQRRQFDKLRADENERALKNSSVLLITHLDKEFYNLEDLRIDAANLILKNKVLEAGFIKNYSGFEYPLAEIYDFFDVLGFYVSEQYVKPEIAHQYFYYWFDSYYMFYEQFNVKQLSGYDETVWINLSKLSKTLNEVEVKQLGKKRTSSTKVTLFNFFTEEAGGDA